MSMICHCYEFFVAQGTRNLAVLHTIKASLHLCSCLITGGKHGFVTRLLDYNSETDVSQKYDNFAGNDQVLFS